MDERELRRELEERYETERIKHTFEKVEERIKNKNNASWLNRDGAREF